MELSGRTGELRGAVEQTFLIADVRGYTAFTREHGDAAAARLAQAFAQLARDAVEARGGQVVELRGDEVLAVFPSPAAAVRAATDLVAVCIDEAASHDDLPLHIGVGIDIGEAVPVDGGFRGAALNTAARLCSQAKGGQVFVSADVAELARELPGVRYVPSGEVELKGFEAPVELIQAVVEDGRRAVAPAVPGEPTELPLPLELELETPLIGRERELAWLRGLWRQARRGYGAIAFVSGPPQIGKTRLTAELASLVVAQGATVTYVGAGGGGAAVAASAIRELGTTTPTLLVVDDLDALGEPVIESLREAARTIEELRALVVAAVRKPDAIPALDRLLDGRGTAELHRELPPLDEPKIRELAELYTSDPDDMPLEGIGRASGGIPGRVHEQMVEWAEQEAARQLAAAAEWIASDRTSRAAGLEFANTVIGLKLARVGCTNSAAYQI